MIKPSWKKNGHWTTTDGMEWESKTTALLHQKELNRNERKTNPKFGHADNRDIRQKIFDDAKYKTLPQPKDATPNESEIRAAYEAKAAAKWEAKFHKASPEDKRLMLLERERDQFIQSEIDADRRQEHIAKPDTAIKLQQANRFLSRIVDDESRTVAEIENAQYVIRCLESPDACPVETNRLFTELKTTENQLIQAKAEALHAEKQRLQGEYEAALAELNGEGVTDATISD